jgi:hypothetical protein
MLIHATVTISGDATSRIACEARLRRLLSGQFIKNEVTEHHGAEALCYDLKVEGGIPFPVFAQASLEFPELSFEAQWVDVGQGEKGGATIVNGRVTARESARVALSTGDDHPVHVEVAPDGRLRLALTLIRAASDEWRGYAVTATRDALVRVTRDPGSGAFELTATEGAAEWALSWRGGREGSEPAFERPARPPAMDDAMFRELEAVAKRFAENWLWLESGPAAEIAVERERYRLYGYGVAAANVRSVHLHRLRADAPEGAALEHSTLEPDDRWVKDLLAATWAKLD